MDGSDLRVALWQQKPPPRSSDPGIDWALKALDEAAAAAQDQGARLLILPELFLGGYRALSEAGEACGLREGSPSIDRVASIARAHHLAIVLGFFERSANGRVFRDRNKTRDSVSADRLATFRCRQLYNSALAVDEDGRLAALYRKTHLFGSAEKAAFSPGERLGPIFELVGGVRCALLICYDIEFPEAGN